MLAADSIVHPEGEPEVEAVPVLSPAGTSPFLRSTTSASVRLVLEASALLSGRSFEGELFVTPEVLGEVRRKGTSPQLEMFLEVKVAERSPGAEALETVGEAARQTRDDRRLSPVDHGLVALAHELRAAIATDDYSIQNLCTKLGLAYLPVMQPGITETVHWRYRCTGCGRVWDAWHEECPDCGARVKTARPGRSLP